MLYDDLTSNKDDRNIHLDLSKFMISIFNIYVKCNLYTERIEIDKTINIVNYIIVFIIVSLYKFKIKYVNIFKINCDHINNLFVEELEE